VPSVRANSSAGLAIAADIEQRIHAALKARKETGDSVRKIAARFGIDPSTVQRISRPFDASTAAHEATWTGTQQSTPVGKLTSGLRRRQLGWVLPRSRIRSATPQCRRSPSRTSGADFNASPLQPAASPPAWFGRGANVSDRPRRGDAVPRGQPAMHPIRGDELRALTPRTESDLRLRLAPSWHRRASRTSGANHSWHFAKGARFPATGESDCRMAHV
jgi:hypothetical protein